MAQQLGMKDVRMTDWSQHVVSHFVLRCVCHYYSKQLDRRGCEKFVADNVW